MTPLEFTLIIFTSSIVAGVLGSLLGLGGGFVVTPVLTLLLGVDIRLAIGASLISVIATSSGTAAAYVRERMANMRVAMLLEIATVAGAITGAYLMGKVSPKFLFLLFGCILAYSAVAMLRKRKEAVVGDGPQDPLAEKLKLSGEFYDQNLKQTIKYHVARTKLGFVLMYIAGVVSGLTGLGSGALKVPAMDLAMRLPIKVSTATSNFMMGVTAAASAGIQFGRGNIDPFIAGPVAAGVVIGATIGSRLLGRLPARKIRVAFVVIMVFTAAQMLWKGTHI